MAIRTLGSSTQRTVAPVPRPPGTQSSRPSATFRYGFAGPPGTQSSAPPYRAPVAAPLPPRVKPPPPPAPGLPAPPPGVLYGNDPITQQALALGARSRQGASSAYLEELKRALLGFGSESLARETFGKVRPQLEQYLGGIDLDPYFSSFRGVDDPDTGFSTLAQEKRRSRNERRALMDALNEQGLFYSGHAVKQLGDFDYDRQAALNNAYATLFSQLGGYGQSFQSALNQAAQGDIDALAAALQRQTEAARAGSFELPPAAPPPVVSTPARVTAAPRAAASPAARRAAPTSLGLLGRALRG